MIPCPTCGTPEATGHPGGWTVMHNEPSGRQCPASLRYQPTAATAEQARIRAHLLLVHPAGIS